MNTVWQVSATLEAVSAFSKDFSDFIVEQQIAEPDPLTLALHELCVNIVEHAYAGQSGMIQIGLSRNAGNLILILTDHGPNMYTNKQPPSMPNPLDLPEGGWGLFLLFEIMDNVDYSRKGGKNIWKLTKFIGD